MSHMTDITDTSGETSKLIGCSLYIQQPAAANLHRKCYTLLLNDAAVLNFDVFPYTWYVTKG